MKKLTHLRLIYLGVGLVLLALVLRQTDLAAVVSQVLQIGWWGIAVVLVIYFGSFLGDSAAWQLALVGAPLTGRWLRRLFLVRMVGEAFNVVTPLGGMGGEPVKAILLKKYYGVRYRESGASLLIAKTTNLIALVLFLGGGFLLLLGDPRVPTALETLAGAGLLALTAGTALFYLVQRFKVTSFTGHRLTQAGLGWRIGHRLEAVVHHIREFDDRVARFYTHHAARYSVALVLALANWWLGVLEVYYAMRFLGHPISLTDAWIIEAIAQLVRAGTFFIPASIGAQEGAFMIVCATLTGNPVLGLAAALIRRFREILWVAAGLGLGWALSFRPARPVPQDAGSARAPSR